MSETCENKVLVVNNPLVIKKNLVCDSNSDEFYYKNRKVILEELNMLELEFYNLYILKILEKNYIQEKMESVNR